MVPVPDGSRPAAIQMSAELGLPYREGLVKNRYVGRTFIMPDQRCVPWAWVWVVFNDGRVTRLVKGRLLPCRPGDLPLCPSCLVAHAWCAGSQP